MAEKLTQQITLKEISIGLERRLKNSDRVGIYNFFWKYVAKSTGFGFDPKTVSGPKLI